MTSTKKKKLAKVRAQDLLSDLEDFGSAADAQLPAAKSTKAKKILPTSPRPVSIQDASSTEEDEVQPTPLRRHGRPPKPSMRTKQPNIETQPTSQKFHKLLETVPVVPEELEAWLNDHGLHDSETINMLEEKSSTLSKLLRTRRTPKTASSSAIAPVGMGSLEDFDQFFLYRNGNKLMILSPVEIFKSPRTVSKKKVFGFIRRAGTSTPLMYSISGYTEYLNPHPKLLDTNEWPGLVYTFGFFYGHRFQTDGWDGTHGMVNGANEAGHAEPQLMLFYACYLLTKLSGVVEPISKQFNRLYRLRDFKSAKTAEIFLSRAPCQSCKRFQELIEDITGISFIIKVTSNVGRISLSRDQYGYEVLPTCAEDSDTENAAHQEELRSMLRQIKGLTKDNEKLKKRMALPMPSTEESESEDSLTEEAPKSRVQIVVPKRRLIEARVPKTDRSPAANVTTKTSKMTTKEKNHSSKVFAISEFADLPRTPRKRRYNSEDDEDYQLPGGQSLVDTSPTGSTAKRKSSRSGLSSTKPPQFESWEDLAFNDSDFEEIERVVRRERSVISLARRLKKFKHLE
jgi:hypothetical protein